MKLCAGAGSDSPPPGDQFITGVFALAPLSSSRVGPGVFPLQLSGDPVWVESPQQGGAGSPCVSLVCVDQDLKHVKSVLLLFAPPRFGFVVFKNV